MTFDEILAQVLDLLQREKRLSYRALKVRFGLDDEHLAALKDSTELIRGLDPEVAQRLLDPALQHMMDAVHRFEGTVNQVLGDGIMALFGAPIGHEDHALRVCYAALAMQAAMRAYTEEVRRTRGLELRMRVGLNSGEVVVRAIGNDLHMDYSAVGETTVLDTVPALLALLDALPDNDPFLRHDPPQRRQRTLEALTRILLRESQVQPLHLVFEDLHWIDTETQALLERLVDSLPTARLLLLVNYRPEYQHGWGSKTYYTQLRLDPLSPASAEELLATLLGNDPSMQPLTRLLIARTEGNPFFLEESVPGLLETEVLVGTPGAYRLVQALPTIQVPATVQAVLAARIDRLPADAKHLLQTAAVIGHEVPLILLQAIADVAEETLHRSLAQLQEAEFLYETRLFSEREYTFKHALTHEVAYGSLLQERKRVLHARIVEALERLAPERLTEQVDRLAHHALRGEVWDKAVAYGQQAGVKMLARSAYREAVAVFEQALVALQHLPENQDTLAQAIDLRFDLRLALVPLGEFGRIFDSLRDCVSHLSFWTVQLGTGYLLAGRLADALVSAQRALALTRTHGEQGYQVYALQLLGDIHAQSQPPDVTLAETHYREALTLAEALGMRPLQAHCRLGLGTLYLTLGQREQAHAALATAIDLYRAMGMTFWLPQVEAMLAQVKD